MHKRLLKAVGTIAASSLLITTVAPVHAQGRAAFTRADYLACQTQDETAFRSAIRDITLTALKTGTGGLDYGLIVSDQWRAGQLDTLIDKQVDAAVEQVRDETSWAKLITSLAYREQARELAQAVAERVYRSDALKAALEALADRVGKEVGQSIVITTSDAAVPAQRCLEAYLGPRYGRTVARSVNKDAAAAFAVDPDANQANVTSGTVLLETSQGIAGAILLLVRRQMAQMAQRLGQRLIGSVLGRLVSVVAGGVGLVLIAKELWELRNGVLPIIATEMKSEASKARVRDELAKSIATQIDGHLDELAERTADQIVEIWHGFRRSHAQVVRLAEEDAKFRAFVDAARPEQLPRLDEIVALVLAGEGETAVHARLANGTLNTALNQLPEAGLQIARETRSLETGLQWHSVAGDDVARVARLEIYRHTQPEQLTQSGLKRLLAFEDASVVKRLAALAPRARDVLLNLPDDQLVKIARSVDDEGLNSLAGYLTSLDTAASQRVLRLVSEDPGRLRPLASARVRSAILSSSDQLAAVGMMLARNGPFDLLGLSDDIELVLEGRVHPLLIWDKRPIAVVTSGLLLLLLLSALRRLLFGGRRRKA